MIVSSAPSKRWQRKAVGQLRGGRGGLLANVRKFVLRLQRKGSKSRVGRLMEIQNWGPCKVSRDTPPPERRLAERVQMCGHQSPKERPPPQQARKTNQRESEANYPLVSDQAPVVTFKGLGSRKPRIEKCPFGSERRSRGREKKEKKNRLGR